MLLTDVVSQRLRNQRITRPGPRRVEKVVAWLGAVQAQEYGPARWGLGLRSPSGVTDAAVERAVDRGRILRTHVLRPTWHFVTPHDIRWMLELTGPRVHARMATYDRQMGLDAGVMTRSAALIERALGDNGCLTRRELGAQLERRGLPGGTRELAHIAMYAELEGLICSGPRRGRQPSYALVSDRAPHARRLQRDEALAELTQRYFRSHGPATVRDFVWWSGLNTPDARRGLEMTRARKLSVDGLTYWTLGRDGGRPPRRKAGVHLLPIYDEYLVAYRDHQAVRRAAYTFGSFHNALMIGGQMAGTWRTIPRADEAEVDVRTQRRLTPAERRGLGRELIRLQRFLGVPVYRTRVPSAGRRATESRPRIL